MIRDQVKFIDTVKYFQQSLGGLGKSMTDKKKENIRETCRRFILDKLIFLSEEDEKWVLDYLCSGKGTIPYQMITNFDSLNITPDGEDFLPYENFYSCLKEENISKKDYENVKKNCKLLKLKTLGDLNRISNFQDTAILCEIFKSRATRLQECFKYNPGKCNSASGFSGCAQRLKSKCSVVLPTDADYVRVFEKTLIGGYSCINTRMGFDTEVF